MLLIYQLQIVNMDCIPKSSGLLQHPLPDQY